VFTWCVCALENEDLGSVLFRAGPLVGSAIWPIAAGLYWRSTNPTGVVWALVLGSAGGLVAYYTLGWYTAALIGTAVSMVIVVTTTLLMPRPDFDWKTLSEHPTRGE
jgi:hypothetical protein